MKRNADKRIIMPYYMRTQSDLISSIIPRLREAHGTVLLLESQKKDHPASNKSYIASAPKVWLKVSGDQILRFDGSEVREFTGDPWEAIRSFYEHHQDWLFGFLGYDLKNHIEDLKSENTELLKTPDLFFFVPGILWEVDSEGKINSLRGRFIPEPEPASAISPDSPKVSMSRRIDRTDYEKKIHEAQKSISEGDYYEINLSHALEFDFEGDPFELYSRMKEAGPVPFASFIHTDDFSICSSSPERFLSKRGNRVFSQPIKGTVSRGDKNEEEALKELRSEKNKAENLMIVDLVRNDLNRIARKGSVQVRDLFEVQSFQTVHQMVSTVECEVGDQVDSVEIIKSCFPMGSMTGAPKIAAMQAIEKLEDYKRGIYSGAIGYLTPEGDFDFNVVIRTAIISGSKLVYPIGGAITSDSVPEQEWEETLVKAKALLNSL